MCWSRIHIELPVLVIVVELPVKSTKELRVRFVAGNWMKLWCELKIPRTHCKSVLEKSLWLNVAIAKELPPDRFRQWFTILPISFRSCRFRHTSKAHRNAADDVVALSN